MAETNQVNIKITNNKVWFFWGVGINAASPLTAIICMLKKESIKMSTSKNLRILYNFIVQSLAINQHLLLKA
jgi:hypothetical protein